MDDLQNRLTSRGHIVQQGVPYQHGKAMYVTCLGVEGHRIFCDFFHDEVYFAPRGELFKEFRGRDPSYEELLQRLPPQDRPLLQLLGEEYPHNISRVELVSLVGFLGGLAAYMVAYVR